MTEELCSIDVNQFIKQAISKQTTINSKDDEAKESKDKDQTSKKNSVANQNSIFQRRHSIPFKSTETASTPFQATATAVEGANPTL